MVVAFPTQTDQPTGVGRGAQGGHLVGEALCSCLCGAQGTGASQEKLLEPQRRVFEVVPAPGEVAWTPDFSQMKEWPVLASRSVCDSGNGGQARGASRRCDRDQVRGRQRAHLHGEPCTHTWCGRRGGGQGISLQTRCG